MRAVIYARYSSDNQREESIEGQLRECLQFANFNEMEVVDNYIDRAFSAKTDNRPNFQQMIKDSAKGQFDVVIVWKLDRFARNRYDSAHYKNILKKNGVKVLSATEKISDDASGILLESMLEGYAEYYSAELAEKVKRGMTENALKGLWNGGQVPFGYKINAERKLDLDPINAPIVEEIFKMCNDGMTVKAIYNNLKERNVLRPNGKPLRYNAVRYILSNRTYIGEYNHSGVKIENSVLPIVSEELFNSVQLELAKNSHAPARHTAKEDYLLTTKLFCGKCGAMMVAQAGTSGTNKKVHRYYACVRQKKHKCDKKMLHKTKIEDYVVYKTMQFLQDDEYIEYLSELLYNLQFTESTILPRLEDELKVKEKEIENILSAVKKGFAQDTLLKELADLEKQRDDISLSIAKEKIECPIFSKDHFKMALSNYRKLDITKFEGKRKLIDTFINTIYVYDDDIKIVYNGNGKEETVTLEEMESSTLFSSGAPNKKSEPIYWGGFFVWYSSLFTFHSSFFTKKQRKNLKSSLFFIKTDTKARNVCYNKLIGEDCMQNKVKNFNDNRTCHKKPMPTFARILNIQSEMGELAKEYLKNSKYGTQQFDLKDDFKEEYGDVLYALISLANELGISCEECLDITLDKLKSRMEKNNSMESEK